MSLYLVKSVIAMRIKLSGLLFVINKLLISQTLIFGYLKDPENKPLNQAVISLGQDGKFETESDYNGYFEFKDIYPGTYSITVNKPGYIPVTFNLTLSSEGLKKDIGKIKLEYNSFQVEEGMITLMEDDLSMDEGPSTVGQAGIGLLQASRDVFSRTAAFELGGYWFRTRGTDNRYNNILFNGVSMSKSYSGRPDFNNWGGLNNVIKYPYERTENNTVSDYSFSDLGGTAYYTTWASGYRKGLDFSYSLTNRTYQQRLMITYSSGMTASGWALTLSGSRRWMEEGVIDGTYNDSYAYFVSVEKKLSDKHRLNLTLLGAPVRRSGASPNTQEVYDLRGKNYNAYWGWQNGDKRSERVKRIFEPVFMLTDLWNINEKTQLTATVSYQYGYNKSSRLNQYEANNPSPTYYKNLPGYWIDRNTDEYETLLTAWQNNDPAVTQINWTQLYNANKEAPLYTDPYSGKTGKRASYFLEDNVIKDKTINAVAHMQTRFTDNWKFFVNLFYQNTESVNYGEVNDLLGSDFVLNKNSFIQGDGTSSSKDDYNILKPGSVAEKGDKTEYYYQFFRQEITANFITRIAMRRWDLAVSANIGRNESYRNGLFMHGLYPDNSYGKSNKKNFTELGLRGGLTYKINGRNFITVNSAYYESSPVLNEIFVNPRLNNDITPNLTNQKINTCDIAYTLQSPIVKVKASGYYTRVKDAVEITRYYAQGVGIEGTNGITKDAFISEVLTGVEKDFLGAEAGIEWKVIPTLSMIGMISLGQYIYSNNPSLYVLSDVSPGLHDYGTAYLKNYKLAGTPQKGYSLGLRYSSPKYWWVGVSGNFLQDTYTDISALSRTMNFILENINNPDSIYPGATPETVKKSLKQKQYQDVFMLNANIGKTFRLKKCSMGISLSMANLLNERRYVTGSFEQGRYSNFVQRTEDQAREYPLFGDKLFYDKGRSYFLNVLFRL